MNRRASTSGLFSSRPDAFRNNLNARHSAVEVGWGIERQRRANVAVHLHWVLAIVRRHHRSNARRHASAVYAALAKFKERVVDNVVARAPRKVSGREAVQPFDVASARNGVQT